MMWVLNRCVAPFLLGVCIAAATQAGNVGSAVGLIGLAGIFAFLSFGLGRRISVDRLIGGLSRQVPEPSEGA